MKLYNTLSRRKEEFTPLIPGKVGMYVCGPTVYDYIHVGNGRPMVVFDALRRYFTYKGYEVNYVQNFTDVDDRIITRSQAEGVTAEAYAERYIAAACEDGEALGVLPPTASPRATREIPGIIQLIETLIQKGHAYEVKGTVFFRTATFPEYGKLSRKNLEELEAGARVEVNTDKQNPTDFVLWKPAKPGEPRWPSPWGEGRPGWHIECSAMTKRYLGDSFDIHAGGEDLIFPHHENEIAQSECANGAPMAAFWLHVGSVNMNGEKMSKSLGNFATLRELNAQYTPEVVHFFILSAHYRAPVNFSHELLAAAAGGWERIATCVKNLDFVRQNAAERELPGEERAALESAGSAALAAFEAALDDDFNTADAIAAVFELVRAANVAVTSQSSPGLAQGFMDTIGKLCGILGLRLPLDNISQADAEIEELIGRRTQARKDKNWAEADAIRGRLQEMGIVLEDTPLGVKWNRK